MELRIRELVDKTDLANIAAFGIVAVILGYAVYFKEAELIATLLGAGIAWLFKSNSKPA